MGRRDAHRRALRLRSTRLVGVILGFAALLGGIGCGTDGPAVRRDAPRGFDPGALLDLGAPERGRALRAPASVPVDQARSWLAPTESVLAVTIDGRSRAYPLQILMVHHVINDAVAGAPIVVSYAPFTDSAVAHSRVTATGRMLTFVGAGKLLEANLVLLDEQTRTLWPQLLGVGVLGELKGTRLRLLASRVLAFAEYAAASPDGDVVARPAEGPYGQNPYVGYEQRASPPEDLVRAVPDRRLPSMARVIGWEHDGRAVAFPVDDVPDRGLVMMRGDVVVLAARSRRSPVDAPSTAAGRLIASAGVFRSRIGARALTFVASSGAFVDQQTGSRWSVAGVALDGPLEGQRLEPVPHVATLWFAWATTHPRSRIARG